MSDDKTTGKVAPRASETPTDKVKGLDLAGLWAMAKGNPLVLVLVATLSGGGVGLGSGQVTLSEIVASAQWWQIMLSVIGLGVLNWMAGVNKTLTKILARLERGDERFTNIEGDVKSLNGWRKQHVESLAAGAAAKLAKVRSDPKLKPRGA